jgi:hypothetical protein
MFMQLPGYGPWNGHTKMNWGFKPLTAHKHHNWPGNINIKPHSIDITIKQQNKEYNFIIEWPNKINRITTF